MISVLISIVSFLPMIGIIYLINEWMKKVKAKTTPDTWTSAIVDYAGLLSSVILFWMVEELVFHGPVAVLNAVHPVFGGIALVVTTILFGVWRSSDRAAKLYQDVEIDPFKDMTEEQVDVALRASERMDLEDWGKMYGRGGSPWVFMTWFAFFSGVAVIQYGELWAGIGFRLGILLLFVAVVAVMSGGLYLLFSPLFALAWLVDKGDKPKSNGGPEEPNHSAA